MNDFREQILRNVVSSLSNIGFDKDSLDKVSDAITIELGKYIVSEMCTDLVVVDTESQALIKLYCGSLLTEGKSKKTVYGYGRLLTRFMNDIGKPIVDVGVFDVRIWLATKQGEVSLRTCENYRAYLSAFFIWLTKEEIIQKNPMAKINPIKYVDKIRYPFSAVELDSLRGACETLRDRAELEFLISSGVRVSELGDLDKNDINFSSLEVLVKNGKGGKQRTTYINDLAKSHLIKYLESREDNLDALFISKQNKRMTKSSIENDLKRIGKRAGVENVHPHRCRRTFATSLSKNGMDLNTIKILMGHSDINTTKEYITLNSDHIQNQYKRFLG